MHGWISVYVRCLKQYQLTSGLVASCTTLAILKWQLGLGSLKVTDGMLDY